MASPPNKNESIDSKIRQQIRERDITDVSDVRSDYEREEKDLKEFFSEINKPIKEDPTLVSKKNC